MALNGELGGAAEADARQRGQGWARTPSSLASHTRQGSTAVSLSMIGQLRGVEDPWMRTSLVMVIGERTRRSHLTSCVEPRLRHRYTRTAQAGATVGR